MAFLAEDGSGLALANAYVDETFFDAYFTDRGNTGAVALTTAQKQVAIIKATDYIDKRFGRKFRGFRENKSQGLEWPRLDAEDDDGYLLDDVPKQLQHATCEYALRAHNLAEGLAPDPALGFNTRDSQGVGTTESASNVEGIREKVGPLETDIRFGSGSSRTSASKVGSSTVDPSFIPAYPAADLLIQELLKSGRDLVRG